MANLIDVKLDGYFITLVALKHSEWVIQYSNHNNIDLFWKILNEKISNNGSLILPKSILLSNITKRNIEKIKPNCFLNWTNGNISKEDIESLSTNLISFIETNQVSSLEKIEILKNRLNEIDLSQIFKTELQPKKKEHIVLEISEEEEEEEPSVKNSPMEFFQKRKLTPEENAIRRRRMTKKLKQPTKPAIEEEEEEDEEEEDDKKTEQSSDEEESEGEEEDSDSDISNDKKWKLRDNDYGGLYEMIDRKLMFISTKKHVKEGWDICSFEIEFTIGGGFKLNWGIFKKDLRRQALITQTLCHSFDKHSNLIKKQSKDNTCKLYFHLKH